MKLHHLILPAILVGMVICSPVNSTAAKPPYFLLTGDTTVARDRGWGDGFFRNVKISADGKNYAKWGSTTETFRFDKYWDRVLEKVKEKREEHQPVVMMQFGHYNGRHDRKMTVAKYREDLKKMTAEVLALGGVPVVISPLPRRIYMGFKIQNEEFGKLRSAALDLSNYGAKTLDLTKAGTEYLNSIGSVYADRYNYEPKDREKLNEMGARVFGVMVADLLVREMPELAPYIQTPPAVSTRIWFGAWTEGNEEGGLEYDPDVPVLPTMDEKQIRNTHNLEN